jgi:hypothetical protein
MLFLVASGIRKQTTFKKQSALGTPAIGAGGQILRRETSVFSLNKANFESTEIVSHQQSTGTRHGMQSPTGKIAGLLSPGTYKLLMATALRKDFVAGSTTGALTNVTAAVTTGASGTFTRAAGSFLTDGFKIGDIVTWTGWTTTGVPNNSHNFQITALTATVMTGTMIDGVAVGAKASGDSVTATVKGKKTIAPLTGHTNDYFTFEEWYPDVAQSELFTDCKLGQMTFDLPANGNSKVTFDLMALARTQATAQQFTSPAVETTTGIISSVTGDLIVGGVAQAAVTGLQLTIAEGAANVGPVIGSVFAPDITVGWIKVTGSFTAYFQDNVLPTAHLNETLLALNMACSVDNTPNSDVVGLVISQLKLTSDAPDDGPKAILRTYSFVGQLNAAGGAALATDQTILSIQDSQA